MLQFSYLYSLLLIWQYEMIHLKINLLRICPQQRIVEGPNTPSPFAAFSAAGWQLDMAVPHVLCGALLETGS